MSSIIVLPSCQVNPYHLPILCREFSIQVFQALDQRRLFKKAYLESIYYRGTPTLMAQSMLIESENDNHWV